MYYANALATLVVVIFAAVLLLYRQWYALVSLVLIRIAWFVYFEWAWCSTWREIIISYTLIGGLGSIAMLLLAIQIVDNREKTA